MSNLEQRRAGGVMPAGAFAMAERSLGAFASPVPAKESVVIAQSLQCNVDVHKVLAVSTGIEDFVIARISRSAAGYGMTEGQPKRAVYAACVHLREFDGCELWCDERNSSSHHLPAGSVHINDMRHSWCADIQGSFDVVNFCIPQSALDEITDDQGTARVDGLSCPIDEAKVDTIATNLALAFGPALMRPSQLNRLFIDHAWRAVTAHFVKAYGSNGRRALYGQSGLAPWQERRAKEMLLADLTGNISIADLSTSCRLSCSHFSQAFRQTVGCPPHQWLLAQRVERSKQLLLNTDQPLSEIALLAGFADQSHFTRVFSKRVKMSSGSWRREQAR